jgi:hypothetical protein
VGFPGAQLEIVEGKLGQLWSSGGVCSWNQRAPGNSIQASSSPHFGFFTFSAQPWRTQNQRRKYSIQ